MVVICLGGLFGVYAFSFIFFAFVAWRICINDDRWVVEDPDRENTDYIDKSTANTAKETGS